MEYIVGIIDWILLAMMKIGINSFKLLFFIEFTIDYIR